MRRYLHSWALWVWCIRKVRGKKHGMGAMPWRLAFKAGASVRHLIDGQHRSPPRLPRYLT